MSPSEGGPHTPQDTAGRRWRDSSPHWHIQEPDLGQQPVCSTAPAGRQGLVSLDGGQCSLWAAMLGGLGDNETFWKCSPWVPDTTSGTSQQASQLGLVLWCFRQIGAGGPTGEKRWLRACCVPGNMNTLQHPVVLKGPCNNQGKRTLPQRCPHGALPVHP